MKVGKSSSASSSIHRVASAPRSPETAAKVAPPGGLIRSQPAGRASEKEEPRTSFVCLAMPPPAADASLGGRRGVALRALVAGHLVGGRAARAAAGLVRAALEQQQRGDHQRARDRDAGQPPAAALRIELCQLRQARQARQLEARRQLRQLQPPARRGDRFQLAGGGVDGVVVGSGGGVRLDHRRFECGLCLEECLLGGDLVEQVLDRDDRLRPRLFEPELLDLLGLICLRAGRAVQTANRAGRDGAGQAHARRLAASGVARGDHPDGLARRGLWKPPVDHMFRQR